MKIKYLEFTQKTVYDFIQLVRPELPLEVAKYYSKKIKNESYYTALGLLKDLLYQSSFPRYNTGIVQDLMILNDLLKVELGHEVPVNEIFDIKAFLTMPYELEAV